MGTTSKAETLASIVEEVNAAGTTWTAAVPDRFETLDDVKMLLGAYLPGDPEYEEEPVQELAHTVALPSSSLVATASVALKAEAAQVWSLQAQSCEHLRTSTSACNISELIEFGVR